jgi:hypothetical protein
MKKLTIEALQSLVRTGSVRRVLLMPSPAIAGGGWYLDVDHTDHGQSRELHTKRGELRVFKSADVAIKALLDCEYAGPLNVTLKPEIRP